MAKCPNCQAEVQGDFGLVECANCGTPLLIEFDGNIVTQPPNGPALEPEVDGEAATEVFDPSRHAGPQTSDPEEVPWHQFEPPMDTPPVEEELVGDAPVDASPVADVPTEDVMAEPPEAQPYDADEIINVAPPDDLAPVSAFANSEMNPSGEGLLRLDLWVSGIDTADIRQAVREALTDKKFLIDLDSLFRTIKMGELKIENISTAKAVIMVSRLRELPVQIRWEQRAIGSR